MVDEDKVIEDMRDTVNRMVSDCFACNVDGHRLNLALVYGIAKTIALHFDTKERAHAYLKQMHAIMVTEADAMFAIREKLEEILNERKGTVNVSNNFYLKHIFNPDKPNA